MSVSRRQLAYETLRERILSLELKPLSPIPETEVANEFGISRTPIREALAALERDGLVTIIRGKGAFVAPSSTNIVLEIYEVREVLEALAARKAVGFVSHMELIDLREVFMDYLENSNDDTRKVLEAANKLHLLIAEGAKNKHLQFLLKQFTEQVSRIREVSSEGNGRLQESSREHIEIIDAILEENPDMAEKMMKKHIQNIRKSISYVIGHV
ncbi:GntR family transcriptional regulator [Alteribacillus sp. YIM 98480]|uniref:GntR family transcriptional regulator n=1 Tax=Alteribacillus sp. YIM 98480 TaxID=2606599 RepID=UPI00131BF544|nr:GntR family transcriptional regulator [Alteribacillus sp. YIM 98480]